MFLKDKKNRHEVILMKDLSLFYSEKSLVALVAILLSRARRWEVGGKREVNYTDTEIAVWKTFFIFYFGQITSAG